MRERQPDQGFTLIEMIVVLVVLALAGSIVVTRGPLHSPALDLRAAARTLATDLRSTRSQAVDDDHELVFTIDPVLRDYGQRGGQRQALPSGIAVTTPMPPILFHPDGSSSGGSIVLTESDHSLVIRVDWLTGRVVLQ